MRGERRSNLLTEGELERAVELAHRQDLDEWSTRQLTSLRASPIELGKEVDTLIHNGTELTLREISLRGEFYVGGQEVREPVLYEFKEVGLVPGRTSSRLVSGGYDPLEIPPNTVIRFRPVRLVGFIGADQHVVEPWTRELTAELEALKERMTGEQRRTWANQLAARPNVERQQEEARRVRQERERHSIAESAQRTAELEREVLEYQVQRAMLQLEVLADRRRAREATEEALRGIEEAEKERAREQDAAKRAEVQRAVAAQREELASWWLLFDRALKQVHLAEVRLVAGYSPRGLAGAEGESRAFTHAVAQLLPLSLPKVYYFPLASPVRDATVAAGAHFKLSTQTLEAEQLVRFNAERERAWEAVDRAQVALERSGVRAVRTY